jgi:hypothetical protein
VGEKAAEIPDPVRLDPRRAALDHALNSHTFARADRLKRFLRYVGEMELDGRGGEITEYSIGTEALGRPASYAPLEDSAVRTTARTLRQKLALFYETEMPDAELRIEIPKGMYRPQFVERGIPAPGEAPRADRRQRIGWKIPAAVATVVVAGLAATVGLGLLPSGAPRVSPLIQEAWAPVAAPGPTVLLCISTPMQMMVRSVPVPAAPSGSYPLPGEFEPFRQAFNSLQGRADAPYLYLEPSAISTTLGEAFAAVRAAQVLQLLGRDFKTMATRTVQIPAIASQRAIVLGGPEYSRTTRQLLERGAYLIQYDPARREQVLVERTQGASRWERTIERRGAGITGSFGLITVLANDSGRPANTISVTGLSSAGIQAAMEFFASPPSLAQLKRELARQGISRFPLAYQVVVRATAYEDQMLSYQYEAHKVLAE